MIKSDQARRETQKDAELPPLVWAGSCSGHSWLVGNEALGTLHLAVVGKACSVHRQPGSLGLLSSLPAKCKDGKSPRDCRPATSHPHSTTGSQIHGGPRPSCTLAHCTPLITQSSVSTHGVPDTGSALGSTDCRSSADVTETSAPLRWGLGDRRLLPRPSSSHLRLS